MREIVVTGAAGFIGSNLVDRLLEDGFRVVGLDSFTRYYSPEVKAENLAAAGSKDGFRLFEVDLLGADLIPLLSEADAVVHLAAEPGVRTSWGDNFSRYLENNVLATQRLLEALKPERQRLVFVSSSSVYGSAGSGPLIETAPRHPASPYGLTKLAAEELVHTYVRETGLSATLLRGSTSSRSPA
ncbi:MAG: NAD-dependent epimerase/dehydratase family protein [Rubrobacter sp.]